MVATRVPLTWYPGGQMADLVEINIKWVYYLNPKIPNKVSNRNNFLQEEFRGSEKFS